MKMLSQSLENYQNLSNRLQMKHVDLHLKKIEDLQQKQDDMQEELENTNKRIKDLIAEKYLYEFKSTAMENTVAKLNQKKLVTASLLN